VQFSTVDDNEHMLIEVLLPGFKELSQVDVVVAAGNVNITVPDEYALKVDVCWGVGTQLEAEFVREGKLVIRLPVLSTVPVVGDPRAMHVPRCPQPEVQQHSRESEVPGGRKASETKAQQRRISRLLQNALEQQNEPLARQQDLIHEMETSIQVRSAQQRVPSN
jgi:hypothetical protein